MAGECNCCNCCNCCNLAEMGDGVLGGFFCMKVVCNQGNGRVTFPKLQKSVVFAVCN